MDTEEEVEGVLEAIAVVLLVDLVDTEEVAVEVQVEDTEEVLLLEKEDIEADHRDDLLVGGIVVALLVDQDTEADRAGALDHIEVIEMIEEMLHEDHMMRNKKRGVCLFFYASTSLSFGLNESIENSIALSRQALLIDSARSFVIHVTHSMI